MAVVFSIFFPAYRFTFFGFAALIAASRIAAGYHYPSDTVAGAALGMAIVAGLEWSFDYLGLEIRPTKRKWPSP
jgi:membrane-associated phospholipid phosphatase